MKETTMTLDTDEILGHEEGKGNHGRQVTHCLIISQCIKMTKKAASAEVWEDVLHSTEPTKEASSSK